MIRSKFVMARIAMAVDGNKTLDDLDEEQLAISARFANPRMPTASAAADMGMKISSVREGFGLTDVFLETQGFDDDTIARTTAQERQVRRQQVIAGIMRDGAYDGS